MGVADVTDFLAADGRIVDIPWIAATAPPVVPPGLSVRPGLQHRVTLHDLPSARCLFGRVNHQDGPSHGGPGRKPALDQLAGIAIRLVVPIDKDAVLAGPLFPLFPHCPVFICSFDCPS